MGRCISLLAYRRSKNHIDLLTNLPTYQATCQYRQSRWLSGTIPRLASLVRGMHRPQRSEVRDVVLGVSSPDFPAVKVETVRLIEQQSSETLLAEKPPREVQYEHALSRVRLMPRASDDDLRERVPNRQKRRELPLERRGGADVIAHLDVDEF